MRAIINEKIYDTEKAEFICNVSIPTNNIGQDENHFNIYKTKNGRIFAEHKEMDNLINDNLLKKILSRPDCVEIYIEIFGNVEEA